MPRYTILILAVAAWAIVMGLAWVVLSWWFA